MRHGIWEFPNVPCTGRSSNMSWKSKKMPSVLYAGSLLVVLLLLFPLSGCGIYSFSGIATSATNIQVDPFFNNTDLGPANIGQEFTNKLKDYFQRNTSLKVAPENGELQIEGTISEYRLTQVAPVSTGSPN